MAAVYRFAPSSCHPATDRSYSQKQSLAGTPPRTASGRSSTVADRAIHGLRYGKSRDRLMVCREAMHVAILNASSGQPRGHLMGLLARSTATLRLRGDALIPDEVSLLLGASPTSAEKNGQEVIGRNGKVRIARTGAWQLDAKDRKPEDLEAQVFELLDQLTPDLEIWDELGRRFTLDLFCGIFMASYNNGLLLSPNALLALGQRSIKLDLDMYEHGSFR